MHKCKYFDKSGDVSDEEIHDFHWHVKQKLFEQEQKQQNKYPDIFQPIDNQVSFDYSQPFQEEQDFEPIDPINADDSKEEQENRFNFYVEEISEVEFKHILDDSDESDESDGECFVSHNNQEHQYSCKKCNPVGYKGYRKMLNS